MQTKKTFLLKLSIACLLCLVLFFGSFGFAGAEEQAAGHEESGNGISNPLQCDSVQECIGNFIQTLLGIVGSLALVMFIYGGFMWMLSGGNEQRIKKGKDILVWSTLGLLIIFTSYAILTFVFKAFVGAK